MWPAVERVIAMIRFTCTQWLLLKFTSVLKVIFLSCQLVFLLEVLFSLLFDYLSLYVVYWDSIVKHVCTCTTFNIRRKVPLLSGLWYRNQFLIESGFGKYLTLRGNCSKVLFLSIFRMLRCCWMEIHTSLEIKSNVISCRI